jgi:predicted transcriptional regulator
MYSKREQRKQDGMRMKDDSEAQTRKILNAEVKALEVRYETLKEYLAGRLIDDFEAFGILRAFKESLSTISAHILTLYQLKGQRAKITWESLLTNIDNALETIQNSPRTKPRAAIETALKMSEPKIEEVMAYLAKLRKSL